MPRPKINRESDRFRRMLHQHLQHRAAVAPTSKIGSHLDEDALSAFVEGRLSSLESAPIVGHLVGCGTCRNITAQLIRLDSELSGVDAEIPAASEDPGRIRRLLGDLASRVLPSSEGDAVFAYHAPADDFEKKPEARKDEKGSKQEVETEPEEGH